MEPVLYLPSDPSFLPEREEERGERAADTGMGT